MQRAFDCLSERVEHLLSTWWGVAAYFGLMTLCGLVWGWDGIDRAIYVTGGMILVLLIGCGRRDAKAIHAKLDRITPGHDLDRIEERAEREIEQARQAVPGVYSPNQGKPQ